MFPYHQLGGEQGVLFTRKMKRETHYCWVVLTRRKTMEGLGIRLVQSPNVTNTAGTPGNLPRAPRAQPGTPELCAGRDDKGVWSEYLSAKRRLQGGHVTALCSPHTMPTSLL